MGLTTEELPKIVATKEADGGWIATFTGRKITPLTPNPDDIAIEDIAHALANQCRFTGHVRQFYSVAQHSVMVSYLVPKEQALSALLHDASEAYLSDIARPIKNVPGFGEMYHEAEDRLEEAVAKRFGTSYPMTDEIKAADNLMLWAEMRDLMPNDPPADVEMYPKEVIPWGPVLAEQKFLARYNRINLGLSLPSEDGDF